MDDVKAVNLGQVMTTIKSSGRPNTVLWQAPDSIAFVARGRELRSEFHSDPSDEVMYMIKGDHEGGGRGRRVLMLTILGDPRQSELPAAGHGDPVRDLPREALVGAAGEPVYLFMVPRADRARAGPPGGTGAGHGLRAGRMGRERVSQTRREPRMRFTERRFPKGPADVPVEVPVPVVPDWTGAGAACVDCCLRSDLTQPAE